MFMSKLRQVEWLSGIRQTSSPGLRFANTIISGCGIVAPVTLVVFGLTVLREEIDDHDAMRAGGTARAHLYRGIARKR